MKKTSLLFALPLLGMVLSAKHAVLQASALESESYSFSPAPQRITYGASEFALPEKIGLSFSSSIDSYTRERTFEVFSSQDVLLGDNLNSSFSLSVSTFEESQGSLIQASDLEGIEAKKDAYCLRIESQGIAIAGVNTDAVYYGLATLGEILNQSHGVLRELIIQDYSASSYRGFIEGYYGVPWTTEQRIELMRYSREAKGNIYIYAPKDDSYHSTNWRGLYNERTLSPIRQIAEAGKRYKVDFTYAIHPFLSSPILEDNYDESLTQIEAKFTQLIEAGVGSFAVSADDIEIPSGSLYTDGSLHRKLLNDLSAFLRQKSITKPLLFVPSAYCAQSKTRLRVDEDAYFSSLMEGLDESVEIFWTGEDVCSSVSTLRSPRFQELAGGKKPLFWLNWPVNDYAPSHLLMGKAEVLDSAFLEGQETFTGVVTNPMQQAEASKPAIYSVCSYAWNPRTFDADLAHQKGIEKAEGKAAKALETLSSIWSNANLYEGRYFEETPSLEKAGSAFETAYASLSFEKEGQALMKELQNLLDAAKAYRESAENQKLFAEVEPWLSKTEVELKQAKASLEILLGQKADYQAYLDTMDALEEEGKACKAPILNKITYNEDLEEVSVGVAVLTPLSQKLALKALDVAKLALGLDTGIVYEGFEGIYSGSLENMRDGDESTYCWFQGKPSQNAYIRIDLGSVLELSSLRVKFGNANGAGDYLVGHLEISEDGKTFTRVGTFSGSNSLFDFRDSPLQTRFLRFVNDGTETWVSVAEIETNVLSLDEPTYSISGIELEPSVETSLDLMGDGSDSTYCWFGINRSEVTTITLDLRKTKQITSILLHQAKSDSPSDFFPNVSFSYSEDGENFTELEGSYQDQKEIEVDLSSAPISARYIRLTNSGSTSYGVVIRQFTVKTSD